MGVLEQTVEQARYLVRFSSSFAWWFLFPTAVVSTWNMAHREVTGWQWLFVLGAFVLAFVLVQLELRRKHLPRLRELEDLQNKLSQEVEPGTIPR